MRLLREHTKLTGEHITVPIRTDGAVKFMVRVEFDEVPANEDVELKAEGCWRLGAWDAGSVDLWTGVGALDGGVAAEVFDVPAGVDALRLVVAPSTECVVRSLEVELLR
jgi:hypothetical protein